MLVNDYISLDLIKDRLASKPVFDIQWNPSEISEWAFTALYKIGAIENTVELVQTFDIENGKIRLPKNILAIANVIDFDTRQEYEEGLSNKPLGYYEYRVQNGQLLFSFENGKVVVFFKSYPLDDNDQPLIPNNNYFISAVEAYIRLQLAEKGYNQRRILINEVDRLERDWNFYHLSTRNQVKVLKTHTFRKLRNRH